MTDTTYRALIVEETGDGTFTRRVGELSTADLPRHENDVLLRVKYSSLNFKDALSATGHKGVTRTYPHTPGIDAAGTVAESQDARFAPGQEVLVTGYDLGMNTPGGFGQYVRVPADWLVPLPDGLSLEESMRLGTAGFTAGLAVHRVVADVAPDEGEVLVTGATGGVGSVAVGLLALLGYRVVAVSGKPDAAEYLQQLGTPAEILGREQAAEGAGRPLLRPRWAAVVDTVGGEPLVAAVKATLPHGLVVACGNVAGNDIPLNVFPFILRGVTLAGVDSATSPRLLRETVWRKLASEWKLEALPAICRVVGLDELEAEIQAILQGQVQGRVVVDLDR